MPYRDECLHLIGISGKKMVKKIMEKYLTGFKNLSGMRG